MSAILNKNIHVSKGLPVRNQQTCYFPHNCSPSVCPFQIRTCPSTYTARTLEPCVALGPALLQCEGAYLTPCRMILVHFHFIILRESIPTSCIPARGLILITPGVKWPIEPAPLNSFCPIFH